nr:MAG TPA: hypothetical protein [Caudoviricetes sp.]
MGLVIAVLLYPQIYAQILQCNFYLLPLVC